MLGNEISDPLGIEEGGVIRGMELLPIKTILGENKKRVQIKDNSGRVEGPLSCISDHEVEGYEIHMGISKYEDDSIVDDLVVHSKNIYGSYVHGLFDAGGMAADIIKILAERKGIMCETGEMLSYREFKETQYDKLASTLREYLDMDYIYRIMGVRE